MSNLSGGRAEQQRNQHWPPPPCAEDEQGRRQDGVAAARLGAGAETIGKDPHGGSRLGFLLISLLGMPLHSVLHSLVFYAVYKGLYCGFLTEKIR